MEDKPEITIEQVEESMEDGTILTIIEQNKLLANQVKNLSKNELSRLVLAAGSYPENNIPKDARKGEVDATKTMFLLKELHGRMANNVFIEKLKEQSEKQKGEENE